MSEQQEYGRDASSLRRLIAWLEREHLTAATPGEESLTALSDIAQLRPFLERAELDAVRAARRNGVSWAEIATRLGVSRQSAWEKWRDLDNRRDVDNGRDVDPGSAEVGLTDDAATAALMAELDPETEPGSTTLATGGRRLGRMLSRQREPKLVKVPNVVGLTFPQAALRLEREHLVAVDGDGHRPGKDAQPHGRVVNQAPEAGARIDPGSHVRLTLRPGAGGAGVRRPHDPGPGHLSAYAAEPLPLPDRPFDELTSEEVSSQQSVERRQPRRARSS